MVSISMHRPGNTLTLQELRDHQQVELKQRPLVTIQWKLNSSIQCKMFLQYVIFIHVYCNSNNFPLYRPFCTISNLECIYCKYYLSYLI